MDTSETYIKMCEKAEEIQTTKVQYFQEHGNFFADNATPIPTWLISCDICFDLTHEPNRFIWLPRQDQLQEIVKVSETASLPTMTQLTLFYQFWQKSLASTHSGIPYFALFTSLEQLWLAFVMKEKYNKVWNGKEWHLQKI